MTNGKTNGKPKDVAVLVIDAAKAVELRGTHDRVIRGFASDDTLTVIFDGVTIRLLLPSIVKTMKEPELLDHLQWWLRLERSLNEHTGIEAYWVDTPKGKAPTPSPASTTKKGAKK